MHLSYDGHVTRVSELTSPASELSLWSLKVRRRGCWWQATAPNRLDHCALDKKCPNDVVCRLEAIWTLAILEKEGTCTWHWLLLYFWWYFLWRWSTGMLWTTVYWQQDTIQRATKYLYRRSVKPGPLIQSHQSSCAQLACHLTNWATESWTKIRVRMTKRIMKCGTNQGGD